MKLCKHHRQVHLAVSIYDSIIKDPRLRDADIKQSLDDYISYTIEWGMLSKATELLYLKINLEEDNMEEQRSAANKLKEIFDYQNTNLLANAKTHVNNWKRVPIDEEYSNMLNEIKAKLSM